MEAECCCRCHNFLPSRQFYSQGLIGTEEVSCSRKNMDLPQDVADIAGAFVFHHVLCLWSCEP